MLATNVLMSLPTKSPAWTASRQRERNDLKHSDTRVDTLREERYLHRLRKTAATNCPRSGFDLMKIKNWLGHKSHEITQIYLDAEMHDPEEQKKLDRAGQF